MEENATTEWCAGLPLVRQRPFEPEEQEALQQLVLRLRRRGILAALSYPLLVCVIGLVTWISTGSTDQALTGMAISGLLLFIVCVPIQFLMVRDAIVRCKILREDLRHGFVKQFAGMMSPDVGMDKTLIQLRQARIVPKTGVGQWSLELLPASRRVWRVQEQHVKPWIVANVAEVATTPEIAAIAAQWIQPVARKDEETLLSGRRELSSGEREELRRYARQTWARPLPIVLGFMAWDGLRIHAMLVHPHLFGTMTGVFLGLFVFLLLGVDMVWIAQWLLSRQLRQAAEAGYVIIVGVETSALTDSLESPATASPSVREVLPFARREWTQNGQPAAWRTIRS